MTPSPAVEASEEEKGLGHKVPASILTRFGSACGALKQKEVLAALLRLYAEDGTLRNRVNRQILDRRQV